MIKYRLEEIPPTTQTLADVPEGEPVDCVYSSHVEKMMRVGLTTHFVKPNGDAGCTALLSPSSIPLWRPTAKPLPTTTDQLEVGMVVISSGGVVHWGETSGKHPIASPIYRVVEVMP